MPASSSPTSHLLIKGVVILGVITAVLSGIALWRLAATRQAEILRYQACDNGTRRDCQPSLFWVLAGLTTASSTEMGNTSSAQTTGKRVTRTSANAPLLTSLRPEGFTPQGTGYVVLVGTESMLTVTAEKAKRVEARFRPTGTSEDILLAELPAVAGKENTYASKVTWTDVRSGELEMRVYGDPETERTSLIVPLQSEPVAK